MFSIHRHNHSQEHFNVQFEDEDEDEPNEEWFSIDAIYVMPNGRNALCDFLERII